MLFYFIFSMAACSDTSTSEFLDLSPVHQLTIVNLNRVDYALKQYESDFGMLPTESQGLNALIEAPDGIESSQSYPPGGYFSDSTLPIDPWGAPFVYLMPPKRSEGKYDLYSLGPDGVESEDDIGNWDF